MSLFKQCCDFRHRYAVLVDNIFYGRSRKISVQENIDKLTFYATSSPEKLDRISFRLFSHLTMFLRQRKLELVKLAYEVQNQLLENSRTSFINLMIDDYMKMTIKLLKFESVELQVLAIKSFRKFAYISVETPKFYDYLQVLVESIVTLATINSINNDDFITVRLAGLSGIQSLIVKTKNSVTKNIWNAEYAQMIVPSLVENLKDLSQNDTTSPLCDSTVPYLNEIMNISNELSGLSSHHPISTGENFLILNDPFNCPPNLIALHNLYELLNLATVSSVGHIIGPIYQYWSSNSYWSLREPTIRLVKLIASSLKPQMQHACYRLLFDEIKKNKDNYEISSFIICNLSLFIPDDKCPSAGHIHFEMVNVLIHCLKESCSTTSEDTSKKETYIDTIVSSIERLVEKIPNYQKSETMQMILNQIPSRSIYYGSITLVELNQQNETLLLLKCLEKLSSLFRVDRISIVLNLVFLEQLAEFISLNNSVQLSVIRTFVNLIDQHDNYNAIEAYLTTLSLQDIKSVINSLEDLSIKKLNFVIDLLILGAFTSPFRQNIIHQLVILICLLCLEVNLTEFHVFICLKLNSIKFTPNTPDIILLQSAIFATIYFIADLTNNSKLLDICKQVQNSRESINSNFWLPSNLISTSITIYEYDASNNQLFFDDTQVEIALGGELSSLKANNTSESPLTQQSLQLDSINFNSDDSDNENIELLPNISMDKSTPNNTIDEFDEDYTESRANYARRSNPLSNLSMADIKSKFQISNSLDIEGNKVEKTSSTFEMDNEYFD